MTADFINGLLEQALATAEGEARALRERAERAEAARRGPEEDALMVAWLAIMSAVAVAVRHQSLPQPFVGWA